MTKFWVESSNDNFDTMLFMQKGKRYTWALFMGHLALEKLFKALFAKIHKDDPEAPRIHNLVVLAERCNLTLTDKQHTELRLINTFNTEARYADYKNAFYKTCDKEFTDKQVKIIKENVEWLKKLIEK